MAKEIKIGVKGDPSSFKAVGLDGAIKSKGAKEYFQFAAAEKEVEKRTKPGHLINRNNHDVTLSYAGEALVIPPRGKALIPNVEKLGGLAPGVVFVPAPALKQD